MPKITQRLTPSGRLESDRCLHLAIGLPLRNREALTNLLEDLYDPSSPSFRHYLKTDQFASSFGPTQEDYQAVIDFAKSHHLAVERTHSNRTLLDVSGSVSDIEKAFHVTMRVYQHPTEARTFFAPDVEPSLDLNTPVLAISGLDNYVKPRPRIHPAVRPLRGPGGGGGGYSGPFEGYDFRTAYAAGVSLDGTGQSVGLFELSGYYSGDISAYEDETGLPGVPLQNILIDGFDGDDDNQDYAVEVTSDIEMAMAMAPNLSSILVYEGPTPLDEAPIVTNYIQDPVTTAQINDVFNQMATDNLAHQLSCSYGMDINLSTVQIFQQFAAQGQSLYLAAGDSGAYPGAIDEPADDPYLTVVGGTTLVTAGSGEGGAWQSEVVWLTPASGDPALAALGLYTPYAATGGGISLAYPIPSWQQGISMTANQGSTTMRNLPDVASVANNINIVWGNDPYYGYGDLGLDDWSVGGTSLAAPLWAGFTAMVNQQAAANGQPPIGFANPALYAIGKSTNYAACFHDITAGVNTNDNSPTKYASAPGYDLCTGWGTITGSNLIQALLSPPSDSLRVTPPLGFTASGPSGGPYTVASETYTLTNISSTPLNWSLVNTSIWLTVSPTAGTLKPGASSTVTVGLNSAASNFLIGNYSGNVSFVNQTAGTSQNRQFNLDPGNGGFETGDFTFWNFVGNSDNDFVLGADDADIGGTNAMPGVADAVFVHSGLYGAYLGDYPTPGTLSQTLATTPGQRYQVSFWLTSLVYEGATTPNEFSAIWNGSTFFAQTNVGAFGWTNLQFIVPATATSTTLEFTFEDEPAALALDDISVQTISPVLQSVSLAGGNITLTWSSMANYSYQLQSASSLNNTQWANVLAPITATNGVVSASSAITSTAQQFYRVILLDP